MKLLLALTLALLSIESVYAQDTVCVGIKCRPVEVYGSGPSNDNAGSSMSDLGSYKSGARNRYATPSRPAHQEVVQKAKEEGTVQQNFRPQMESSSSLKIQNLRLGMCLVNPQDQSAFYKIVELDKNSGMVRYVKENEIHNNELKAKIVFFHMPEANDLKSLKVWPCDRTPNLGDEEYVRACTKDVTASGDHLCNPRSQITGKLLK